MNLTGWRFVARRGSCGLRLHRFTSSTSRPATATLQGTIAPCQFLSLHACFGGLMVSFMRVAMFSLYLGC
jgi:hypothetical protein